MNKHHEHGTGRRCAKKMYEPELGQLVYGNSYGNYRCPEWMVAFLDTINDEIWRITHNCQVPDPTLPGHYGISPGSNQSSELKTSLFEMRSYYWGDCTCGWGDLEFDEPHEDSCFHTKYTQAFPEMGFGEEVHKRMKAWVDANNGPESGWAVYCTCSHEKHFKEWAEQNKKGPNGHAIDCPIEVPNFKYKDIEVRWYKYLGRGCTVNRAITPDEGAAMLADILGFLRNWEKEHDKREHSTPGR